MKAKCFLISSLVVLVAVVGSITMAEAAQEDKTFEWIFANYSPTKQPTYRWLRDVWVPTIEKRTGGRLKIKLMWGQTLCPAKQQPEAVKSGMCDLTLFVSAYYPDKFPLWTAFMLPFLMPEDYFSVYAMEDEIGRHPLIEKELDRWNCKFLGGFWAGIYDLMGTKRITSIEDLKGTKIRAIGGSARILKKFGAAPVQVTAPEMFDALSKGVIEAACHTAGSLEHYGLGQVAKYYTELALNTCEFFLVVNKKSYNALPSDLKQIFLEENTRMAMSDQATNTLEQVEAKRHFKKAGIEFLSFNPEDREKMKEGCKEIWDEWVERMESKGLPGREFLDWILERRKYYEPY
jgi:TRAP-type C4-dicarboxylate transport system substrate-binding protein